jgi:hypothetical protein
MDWLSEAKKRFGLCVLDYMVTSNHIHLLVYGREGLCRLQVEAALERKFLGRQSYWTESVSVGQHGDTLKLCRNSWESRLRDERSRRLKEDGS